MAIYYIYIYISKQWLASKRWSSFNFISLCSSKHDHSQKVVFHENVRQLTEHATLYFLFSLARLFQWLNWSDFAWSATSSQNRLVKQNDLKSDTLASFLIYDINYHNFQLSASKRKCVLFLLGIVKYPHFGILFNDSPRKIERIDFAQDANRKFERNWLLNREYLIFNELLDIWLFTE